MSNFPDNGPSSELDWEYTDEWNREKYLNISPFSPLPDEVTLDDANSEMADICTTSISLENVQNRPASSGLPETEETLVVLDVRRPTTEKSASIVLQLKQCETVHSDLKTLPVRGAKNHTTKREAEVEERVI